MNESTLLNTLTNAGFEDADKCISVCALMRDDGKSMRQACKDVGIDRSTFCRRVDSQPELARHYARARDELLEYWAEQVIELSDQEFSRLDDGRLDTGEIQKARLQVESRKWTLSKLKPKKYGDKHFLIGDEDNPVTIQRIERVIVDKPKAIEANVIETD